MKLSFLVLALAILQSPQSGAACPAPDPLISDFQVIGTEPLKPKCIDYSKPSSTAFLETDQCRVTLKDRKSGKSYVALVLEPQCNLKNAKLTLLGACCSDVSSPQGYCLNYKPHQVELDSRSDDYACSIRIPYLARPPKKGDESLVRSIRNELKEQDERDLNRKKVPKQ